MQNIQPDSSQATLRRLAAAARSALSPHQRREASEAISKQVLRLALIRRGLRIACYISMRSEVDTWPLLNALWGLHKRVHLPIVDRQRTRRMRFITFSPDSRLRRNPMGVREPTSRFGRATKAHHLDVILVPLVAFDAQCRRIGMGGGYFDTTFAFLQDTTMWRKPRLIGLAFDCQRVDEIIPNPWDISLDLVVTESACYSSRTHESHPEKINL